MPHRIQIRETDWELDELMIRAIRTRVFVEEQQVDPALDFDGSDTGCLQVIALLEQRPVGTARIDQAGKIGRMAVLAEARNQGIGRAMLEYLCTWAKEIGFLEVNLHAQQHALKFYVAAGFQVSGKAFEDADIMHLPMIRTF